MKIKDLNPAAFNPRKISDEKLEMLGKAMQEFGDLSGIVVNLKTGNLIGGHQRVKHFNPSWPIKKHKQTDSTGTVALGEIETPFGLWSYREVDWPEKKELAANIAANQHGGEFDEQKLKDQLIEINDGSIDMALTGFDTVEISDLLGDPISDLKYVEADLRPYTMSHILISFPPGKLLQIKEHLEKILEIDGVEYEQSAN
jgi:hypothetical protein